MTTEQLEALQELIARWRLRDCGTGNPDYDNGRESAYNACADWLEEVVQTFTKDEES
jgi:hypothetical protein